MQLRKEALFIGGTGTISMAITELLATRPEWHLTVLNRGNRKAELPAGVDEITVDINDEAAVLKALNGKRFETVCDFIGFVPAQVERDYRLFKGITNQYMYISSASAYAKLPASYRITEGTTLSNPYWEGVLAQQNCMRGIPYEEVPGGRLPGDDYPAESYL